MFDFIIRFNINYSYFIKRFKVKSKVLLALNTLIINLNKLKLLKKY